MPSAELSVSNTITHPLVLRNKTTFASKTSTARVRLLYLTSAARTDLTGATPSHKYTVTLVKNPTIENTPTYSDIDTNFSVVEKATDATITAGTGTTVFTSTQYIYHGNVIYFTKENQFIDLYPGETLSVQLSEEESSSDPDSAYISFSLGWEEYY